MIPLYMDNIYLPLISGLVGALIGSASSILVMLIQPHHQTKRELLKHGGQIALEEYKLRVEHANRNMRLAPISLWIRYHLKMIKLARTAGSTACHRRPQYRNQLFNRGGQKNRNHRGQIGWFGAKAMSQSHSCLIFRFN